MQLSEVPIPQVDLAQGGHPRCSHGRRTDPTRIVNSGIGFSLPNIREISSDVLVTAWITTGGLGTQHPAVVKGFREAIDEGLAFIRSNLEQEAKEIEKSISASRPRFPTFSNGVEQRTSQSSWRWARNSDCSTGQSTSRAGASSDSRRNISSQKVRRNGCMTRAFEIGRGRSGVLEVAVSSGVTASFET